MTADLFVLVMLFPILILGFYGNLLTGVTCETETLTLPGHLVAPLTVKMFMEFSSIFSVSP